MMLPLFFSVAKAETSATDSIKVIFLNPGISYPNDPTGGFWLSVSAFMKAAAEDFNIDLEIIYAERDHLLMREQGEAVVKRKKKPDFLIVVNEKQAADHIVKAADAAVVKTFMLLNTFEGRQKELMVKPRAKYKYYLGSLVPDNEFAA
jgi:ABC-type sugar transport system substrate-binding protein